MIFLNPREYRIIRHALTEYPDLSRDKLAEVAGCHPVSIGRTLTRLKNRGLVTIERGQKRRILSITPTFPFEERKTFWIVLGPRKASS